MNKIFSFIFMVIAGLAMSGCQKNESPASQASLNIVHAIVNVPAIKVNRYGSGTIYSTFIDSVKFGANEVITVVSGNSVPVSVVNTADTLHPVFNGNINVSAGSITSLFLAGQSTSVDTITVQDVIPYRADSTAGVRFINLLVNSNPVSINIKGNANGSEVTSLAYKANTGFKNYTALNINASYIFEIRDAGTGTLITSYTLTTPRFLNVTLCLKGLSGATGTNAPGIMLVKNY
ncbi:MAG: hypothetical protein V4539_17125 [Bacteroidota bacterium]